MIDRIQAIRIGFTLGVSFCVFQATFADERDRVWALYADHLPEYCLYTQRLPDQTTHGKYGHPLSQGHYKQRFGATWHHLHHYCWALQETYEAMTTVEEGVIRRGILRAALVNFDYVLVRSDDDFELKPEIYVQKAVALEQLEQYGEAAQAYTEALRLNPDFVPAYVGLSQYFAMAGEIDQALEIVEDGLKRVPGSETLLQRRLELNARSSVQRR